MKKFSMILSVMAILAAAPAYADTAVVKVHGLVCDFCARALNQYFMQKPEVEKVNVNLDTSLVKIIFKKGKNLSDEAVKNGVTRAGFKVEQITHEGN